MPDWAAFDTPYGPRTGGEVPKLLDRIDTGDARVRARALQDLHRRLVAIGGGYGTPFLPIAEAAIPALVARLDGEGTAQILGILGDVAAGNHRLLVGRGLPRDLDARDDIGPARAIQTAVAAHAVAIRSFLDAKAPETRAAAAFALAWLPDVAEPSIAALREHLAREKNVVARTAMWLALGHLKAPGLGALLDGTPVSALAVAMSEPAALDDVLDVALAPIAKPVMRGLPFLDGAILRIRTMILAAATIRRGDLAKHEALLARLPPELAPEAEGWTVLVAAGAGDTTPLDPLDPETLAPAAREVLRAHAARLRVTKGSFLYQAFLRAGLFGTIDCNERALGVDPPGALDVRVDGHPLWWWLHQVRAGRVPFETWLGVVRRSDARAALEDAATAPYELYRDKSRVGAYDVGPLVDVLERTAKAVAVESALFDERLAKLREHATNPTVIHGKGSIPWP